MGGGELEALINKMTGVNWNGCWQPPQPVWLTSPLLASISNYNCQKYIAANVEKNIYIVMLCCIKSSCRLLIVDNAVKNYISLIIFPNKFEMQSSLENR